jgi:two-component system sensor histidine kinase YesM
MKEKSKSEHFTGIGINNVDDRIKLIYGTEYGIHIVSQVNKGTTVTIVLPKKTDTVE